MRKLEELLVIDKFVIAGNEYESNLEEDLNINVSNLTEEFAKQARLAAIYGFASDRAIAFESALKVELDKIYALVDARTRNTAKVDGSKLTEKMVENVVITSPEYQAKMSEYQEARIQSALLKSAKDAIVQRRDMLIGLGANYRAELQSEPTIRNR